MTEPAKRESKSERTRSAIIDAALKLFRERGYDATTMRAIADEASVSVGNAYYYFKSKEQLIQGFYDRVYEEHSAASRPVLDRESDLTARIVGVGEVWLRLMDPYRPFAGKFFKNAAEPTSPLSPFSSESAPARAASIELWREVLEGSDARIAKRLRERLPQLVWLYFMGIVLFWVHDRTEDASATRAVLHRTAPLIVRAIGLARMPVMRGVIDDVIDLVDAITEMFSKTDSPEAREDDDDHDD